MKKKLLIVFMFAFSLTTLLAEDVIIDGIGYNLAKQKAGVAYCYFLDGDIEIPQTIDVDGTIYNVVNIESSAFENRGIRSIKIPDSITEIGSYAFAKCSNLQIINIPQSVLKINYNAFQSSENILEVNITDLESFLMIDFGGFTSNPLYGGKASLLLNGKSITEIDIPESVTKLNSTFAGFTKLQSVKIPNSVTDIESYAFYHCSGLTSVTLPNSVTSIGTSAFAGCYNLASINIPNSVTKIGSFAFDGCI